MFCKVNTIKQFALLIAHFTSVSSSTLPINWTLATFSNLVLERQYTYPAYNEVAPSPCDLTHNFCDIFCCSDVDCSSEEKSSFPCRVPTKEADLEDLLSCDSPQDFQRPGWFSFFCYVSSNTPLLGRFFDLRRSFGSLRAMKRVVSPLETFSFGLRQEQPPSTVAEPAYRYGKPVRIFWRASDVPDWGELRLPRNTVGHRCGQSFPVRYLVNQDAVCVERITREQCEEGSAFGVLRYAVASTTASGVEDQQTRFDNGDDDAEGEERLGMPFVSVDGDTMTPADTATEFLRFCNGSEYLTFSRSLSRDEERRLPQEGNDDDYEYCQYEYEIDPPSLKTSFNESSGVCHNVVVSVEYRLVWKGPEVKKLSATYVLVDVPTSVPGRDEDENLREVDGGQDKSENLSTPLVDSDLTVFVTRTFSVSFQYERPNSNSSKDGEVTVTVDNGDGNNASATVSPDESSSNAPQTTTGDSDDGRHRGLFAIGAPTEEKGEGNGTYQDKTAIYMWSGGE